MLSYLAPKYLTAAFVAQAIFAGDLLRNRYNDQLSDDVKLAWGEHLRPALEAMRARMEQTENERRSKRIAPNGSDARPGSHR
jgi:hypothetical protein